MRVGANGSLGSSSKTTSLLLDEMRHLLAFFGGDSVASAKPSRASVVGLSKECCRLVVVQLRPMGQIQPAIFVNKVLLEFSCTHLFTCCLWLLSCCHSSNRVAFKAQTFLSAPS